MTVESSEFNLEKKSDDTPEYLVYQGKYFSVLKVKINHRWEICKSINVNQVNNPVCHESLRREFEIGSQLQHPSISTYYRMDKNSNAVYREWIDGLTWNEYFLTYPYEKLSLGTYFIQLLEAVTYLHAKEIFHMDLKSENILINYELKNLKIIDFGHSVYQNDTLWRGGTKSTIQNDKSISAKHDWDCIFYLFDGQEFSDLKEFSQNLERIKQNYQKNNFKVDLGFSREILHSKPKSKSKTLFTIASGIFILLASIIYFISISKVNHLEKNKIKLPKETVEKPNASSNRNDEVRSPTKNPYSKSEKDPVQSSRTIPENDSTLLVKMASQFGSDLEKEIAKDAGEQTKHELFNRLIKRYNEKFDQCQELKHLNPEQLEKAKKIYDFHISKSANKYVHILR